MQVQNIIVNGRQIVSCARAAVILGVTVSRISALCSSGKIQYVMIGRFKHPHLDSVLEYQTNEDRIRHAPKSGVTMPTYMKKSI